MSDNYYPKRLRRIAYENAVVLGAAAHDIIKDAADRMEGLETKLTMCEMALRVAHLPLPPYETVFAAEDDLSKLTTQ